MREHEEVPGTESNATETGKLLEDSQRADLVAYRQALASKVKGGFIELDLFEVSRPVSVKPEHIGTVNEVFTSDGTFISTELNGIGVFAQVINRREQILELIGIANASASAQAAIDTEWRAIAERMEGQASTLRHYLADLLHAAHGRPVWPDLRELTRRCAELPDWLTSRVRDAIELLQDARRGHVLAKADAERELQKCATQALQSMQAAQDANTRYMDALGLLQDIGKLLGLGAGTPPEEIVKVFAEKQALYAGILSESVDLVSEADKSSGLRKALGDAKQRHAELMFVGESLLNAMGFAREELDAASQDGTDEHGGMLKLLSTMPARLTELVKESERMRGELQHRDSERAELVRELGEWAASYEKVLALLGLPDDPTELPFRRLPDQIAAKIEHDQQERAELVRELGELRKEQTQLRAESHGDERVCLAEQSAVQAREQYAREVETLRQRLSVYEPGEAQS